MSAGESASRAATEVELRSILGNVDDATILEIMGLSPTVADLEEAVTWVSGDGDVLGKQGRPLMGIAAQVYDILARGEQDPEE